MYSPQHPPRIHFVVPLGAGRTDDGLTPASIARLDEGLKIAERENAFGLVALGDYFSTWRQGEPYNDRGADLRSNYLMKRKQPQMDVIKIPRGSDTLQELVSLRDIGRKHGLIKMIIVTHPEHVTRVQALSELIFTHPYYKRFGNVNFTVDVESGNLPAGLINPIEETKYLETTVNFLRRKYPPDGIIPIMTWGQLNPPIWIKNHAELYTEFQAIYQDEHREGARAPDFYIVSAGKEKK
jgi:hypothetical protein